MPTTGPDPESDAESREDRIPIELEIVSDGSAHSRAPDASSDASADSLLVPADYRPRKCADVLELDMGDGAILYDNEARLVHHLNPSATLVWQLCDGSGTTQELARDIAGEFGLDEGTVFDQVTAVIAELDALGLVEDASSSRHDEDELRPRS